MDNSWSVMGFTYLLSAAVSLLVAALIHVLVILIQRFGSKPVPAAVPAAADYDAEIAVAVAVALRQQGK